MGFRFYLNETVVGIAILELGNNSYSILWFFLNLQFTIYLGKIILGVKILIIKF
jgi:hypothetical protein